MNRFIVIFFIFILSAECSRGAANSYENLLTSSDIEKVTSISGVKLTKLYMTKNNAAFNIVFPDKEKFLFFVIEKTKIDFENYKIGYSHLYRLNNLGDSAFFVPGNSLIFRKGIYTVAVSRYSKHNSFPNVFFKGDLIEESLNPGDKNYLSDEQLIAIARIIDSRIKT